MKNKWMAYRNYCRIVLAYSLLAVVSCSKDKPFTPEETGGGIIDEQSGQPLVEINYEDDIDPEEFRNNYQGIPFKKDEAGNSQAIVSGSNPTTIEAEDFDDCTEPDIAFHFKESNRSNNYRTEQRVAISSHGNGGYHIGNVSSGDWLRYTLNVTEAGAYSIESFCVTGSGRVNFYFTVDGKSAGQIVDAPEGDWGDYTQSVTVTDVQLSEGKHILTWNAGNSMNIDRFKLTRTGEYTGASLDNSLFQYPITKYFEGNPLFVDFLSPMHENAFTGPFYSADPSAHVWEDGRLYVYASHDVDPPASCANMDRYHVFSTADMKNWTDHGEIMNSATVRKMFGTTSTGKMWAPDCAYNKENKTYYFYFPHKIGDREEDWRIFVATSKEPAANFRLQGYIEGVPPTIDPCIFVDDDGQPYIYTSGGGHGLWAGKLRKDDWTKLDGEMLPQDKSGFRDFHEGPWMHKYNGKYYLSHSDNHSGDQGGNQLQYSIGETPLDPWTPCGVYMYPTGESTAHGSIVQFNGQWYAFYHTKDYSRKGALRSVCVDKLEYEPNGHIKVVQTWGTPRSGSPKAIKLEEGATLEAENYNDGGYAAGYFKRPENGSRPQVETGMEEGMTYIKEMKSGEWVCYSIDVKEAGRYSIRCLVKQNYTGGKFRLAINGITRTGDLSLKRKGEWEEVQAFPVELQTGQQVLAIQITGGTIQIDKIIFGTGESRIPGIIQAADYDEGEGAYSFKNGKDGNHKGYREDQGVAISSSNGKVHISNTSPGDWLRYTFSCEEAGTYDIKVYAATPNEGKFALSLDGDDLPERSAKTNGWTDFSGFSASESISLSQGKHYVKLKVVQPLNLEKLEFIKKGN